MYTVSYRVANQNRVCNWKSKHLRDTKTNLLTSKPEVLQIIMLRNTKAKEMDHA